MPEKTHLRASGRNGCIKLLLELVHGEGVVVPAGTRAALESLVTGGKGKSLRKQLLV